MAHRFVTKQRLVVRLLDEVTDDMKGVARVEGTSVNQPVKQSLVEAVNSATRGNWSYSAPDAPFTEGFRPPGVQQNSTS